MELPSPLWLHCFGAFSFSPSQKPKPPLLGFLPCTERDLTETRVSLVLEMAMLKTVRGVWSVEHGNNM